MNRDDKLAQLKSRQLSPVMVTGVEPFVDALEEKIDQIKEALGAGVELKNTDDLLEQLGLLQAFHIEVRELKDTIRAIKLPGSISVEGLDELVQATRAVSQHEPLKVEQLDSGPFIDIAKQLDGLVNKIDKLKVETPGQKPEDFMPIRRVQKVGNRLLFDDANWSGGGGGGAAQTGLLPFTFDDIQFSNADVNGNYQHAVVKSLGKTLATLTLTYDGSSKLTGVTRT